MVSFPNFYWIYDRHLVVGWCRSFLLHANRSGSQTRLPPLAAGGTPSAAARLTAGCARALEMRPARQRRHPQGVPWNYVYNLGRSRLQCDHHQFSGPWNTTWTSCDAPCPHSIPPPVSQDLRRSGDARVPGVTGRSRTFVSTQKPAEIGASLRRVRDTGVPGVTSSSCIFVSTPKLVEIGVSLRRVRGTEVQGATSRSRTFVSTQILAEIGTFLRRVRGAGVPGVTSRSRTYVSTQKLVEIKAFLRQVRDTGVPGVTSGRGTFVSTQKLAEIGTFLRRVRDTGV